MDRQVLADITHANVIAANRLIGSNAAGAEVHRSGGVTSISTRLPVLLFNVVVIDALDATEDGLASAVCYMRDRGTEFVVNLRLGTDDRFVELVGALGLVPMSDEPWLPGMALTPIPTDDPDLPPRYEIRRVTDAAGLADHVRTGAVGSDLSEDLFRAVMTDATLATDGVVVYVGYLDGEPVTTGLGVRTGSTLGVYNIATIPSARGRGYGGAMTSRVALDGAAAGCDVAILQASRMGFSVYERLGYRTVVEYMGYVEPRGQ
jgi:GNAT superfamily N-acetyltransferase